MRDADRASGDEGGTGRSNPFGGRRHEVSLRRLQGRIDHAAEAGAVIADYMRTGTVLLMPVSGMRDAPQGKAQHQHRHRGAQP